jgi:hypothetical protein
LVQIAAFFEEIPNMALPSQSEKWPALARALARARAHARKPAWGRVTFVRWWLLITTPLTRLMGRCHMYMDMFCSTAICPVAFCFWRYVVPRTSLHYRFQYELGVPKLARWLPNLLSSGLRQGWVQLRLRCRCRHQLLATLPGWPNVLF